MTQAFRYNLRSYKNTKFYMTNEGWLRSEDGKTTLKTPDPKFMEFWDKPIPARARKTDPTTSHQAADSFTIERLTEIQKDVLRWFMQQPQRRGTDEQLEADPGLKAKYPAATTVSKRRTDLRDMGILQAAMEDGKILQVKNKNNRNQIVWEVTDEGARLYFGVSADVTVGEGRSPVSTM